MAEAIGNIPMPGTGAVTEYKPKEILASMSPRPHVKGRVIKRVGSGGAIPAGTVLAREYPTKKFIAYDNAWTGATEVQVVTLTGFSGTDEFKLTYDTTETIAFVRGTNATAAAIQTAMRTATGDSSLTVAGTTDAGPFTITFSAEGDRFLTRVTSAVGCTGVVTRTTTGTSGGTTAVAILLEDIDTTAEEVEGNVLFRGAVKYSALVGIDSNAITDLNGRADTASDLFIF